MRKIDELYKKIETFRNKKNIINLMSVVMSSYFLEDRVVKARMSHYMKIVWR